MELDDKSKDDIFKDVFRLILVNLGIDLYEKSPKKLYKLAQSLKIST